MSSVRVTGVARGAACLLACAFASHSALAGPGDLDASFGINGFARPTLPGTTAIQDAALQRDGKIVIVGEVNPPAAGGTDRNAIVIRLNPNGSLDASFSGDGIAIVDFGGNDRANGVLITADDKILIAGDRFGGLPTGSVPTLARLNADGSLDATFGQGGTALYSPFFDIAVGSLVELSDGRFVAGGFKYGATRDFAMFAVGSNGAPDTTFGTNGRQVVDFAGAEEGIVDMRRLSGDRVIAVGETNDDGVQSIGLMLVNSAGQLDSSFGPAAAVLRIGDWDSVQDIELQADGKLLIAGGQLGYGFPVLGMVVRLNPDGTIDRSFGSEGRILRSDEVKQVVSDANGRIYFAGELTTHPLSSSPYGGRGYVEAVERDGATARTFAASGGTTIDVGREGYLSAFTALALLRQSDGRLVVVGERAPAELIVVGIAAGGEHAGVLSVSRPVDVPATVGETAPGVSFVVERTGGSDGTVSVSYVAESSVAVVGQDFVATSGTLTWGDGETATKTITLPLIDDNDFEPENPDEPIAIRIFDPTGGASLATSSAGVFVRSDEKMTQVDLAGARVSESAGIMSVIAKRVGDARVRAVVEYSVTGDNVQAQPNVDFTPVSGTLTWEPFDLSARLIAIPILDDAVLENAEEQVRIQLSSTSPGVSAYGSVNATIVDNDGSYSGTVYQSVSAVAEGAGSLTVTFGRYGNINVPVTANVSILDPVGANLPGPDHGAPNVTQVSWAANESTARTVTIPILDDAVAEGPEQFTVLIEVPGDGSNAVNFFTILDNDTDVSAPSQLSFAQAEMNVAESVGTVSVTVNRGGAAAFPVVGTVTVSGSDLIPSLNYSVSWAGGDSAPKTIVVPIANDTIAEPRKALTVGLKDVFGGARVGPIVSTRINVVDDDGFTNTVGFAQGEIVISEDADYVDLPITTTEPRDTYGPQVSFVIRSGGTADAGREFVLPRTPQSFSLPQHDTSFRIYLNGDNQFEDEETFTVDLVTGAESMPIGRGSVTVRLTSDDSSSPGAPMQVGFVTTAITQREDQSVVNVTVRRMGAADSAVAVRYETAAGSATAGSDFVAAIGQLQWAAGDMADKTIALMLTNDTAVESTETMTLRLLAPTNGATLAEGTATISITDDESGVPPSNDGGTGGGGGGGGGGGSLDPSMLFALLLLGALRVRSLSLRTGRER